MNQIFSDYLDCLRGKHVTVIGIGISNRPLIHMLVSAGAHVTACDKNESIERAEWENLGITLRLGASYLENLSGDILYRTPGLRPDHPALLRAAAEGAQITSEISDFLAVCPCPVFGVTGSDGKTTTATLIAEMLRESGFVVHLGGNIGAPLLTRTGEISPNDLCVVELSSFQLMDIGRSPNVSVITNISPNHLDWHRDMEEYIAAKKAVITHQKPGDRVVLNRDNAITAQMEGLYETQWFGLHRIDRGCIDGFLPLEQFKLRGWHNVENIMAAVTAVRGTASDEAIESVTVNFTGVAHRDELVATLDGVYYYNDSIGSSPSRTIATLLSHPGKVHLIAGGRDKKVPFDPLCEILPKHVKCLYLIGEASEQIEETVRRHAPDLPVVRCGELFRAVLECRRRTESGDTVLLSPACTSFDQYKNFEERGQHFCEIISSLHKGTPG